jgi:diketogulonate reductase-like aldo/keto reductase
MPDDVTPERVAAAAAMARVRLTPEDAARIARAVTTPVRRLADIALEMEVEPATFVAVQRKDAAP